MDRTQELETVKTAYFLEEKLQDLRQENDELLHSKPSQPIAPSEPKEARGKADLVEAQLKSYPDIIPPQIKLGQFWKRGLILLVISFVLDLFLYVPKVGPFFFVLAVPVGIVGVVFLIKDWSKAKQKQKSLIQEHIEKVKNSEEYKNQCRNIDEYNQKEQQRVDELNKAAQAEIDKRNHENYLKRYEKYKADCQAYQIELKNYKDTIIPYWKTELSYLAEAIKQTEKSLQEVYDTNIIPAIYRNISALCYLTMYLSTSNYDLKEAISRYDAHVADIKRDRQISLAAAQVQIGREALSNQQYANWLNEQMAEMSEQGNATLRSISNWQKADIAIREYRRYSARKAIKNK